MEYLNNPTFALNIEAKDLSRPELLKMEKVDRLVARFQKKLSDFRDLAPEIREIFGSDFQVGTGSSHIYISRVPALGAEITDKMRDFERIAIIN